MSHKAMFLGGISQAQVKKVVAYKMRQQKRYTKHKQSTPNFHKGGAEHSMYNEPDFDTVFVTIEVEVCKQCGCDYSSNCGCGAGYGRVEKIYQH